MARGTATGLSGVLCIDKPAGVTSHDVVNTVRRATGERRVGHAGTLDPMATGVLVVLVGPATRLAAHLHTDDKEYRASITFGTRTDTDDADGAVVSVCEVPEHLSDTGWAATQVSDLVGPLLQTPPAYSAIKLAGRKAYDLARAGEDVRLTPREVVIHEARLESVSAGPPVTWDVDLRVSKGFYVRSLARDLGEEYGVGAHLSALRRLSSGRLTIAQAEQLDAIQSADDAVRRFTPSVDALGLVCLEADDDMRGRVDTGSPLACPNSLTGTEAPVAITSDGRLLAIYRRSGTRLRAEAVFPGGVA